MRQEKSASVSSLARGLASRSGRAYGSLKAFLGELPTEARRNLLIGAGGLGLGLGTGIYARRGIQRHKGSVPIEEVFERAKRIHDLEITTERPEAGTPEGSHAFYDPARKAVRVGGDIESSGVALHELGHASAHQRGSPLTKLLHNPSFRLLGVGVPFALSRLAAPALPAIEETRPRLVSALGYGLPAVGSATMLGAEIAANREGAAMAEDLGAQRKDITTIARKYNIPSYLAFSAAAMSSYPITKGVSEIYHQVVDRMNKESGELSARGRKQVKDKNFVFPDEEKYPIHDIEHGRNALARVSAHGTQEEKEKVREAVYSKYPSLKKEKEKKADSNLLPAAMTAGGYYGGEQLARKLVERLALKGHRAHALTAMGLIGGSLAGLGLGQKLSADYAHDDFVSDMEKLARLDMFDLLPMGKLAAKPKPPPAGRMTGLKREGVPEVSTKPGSVPGPNPAKEGPKVDHINKSEIPDMTGLE